MGHWYTKDGEPMHWIEGANGKMRDTTLRDARKLNLRPSVTEIINTIDKPALTRWKLKQVTAACYNNDSPAGLYFPEYDDYHSEMMNRAFADSTDARDRGSEIHDAMERWFKLEPAIEGDIFDIADAACHEIVKFTGTDKFTSEQTVSGDGYGGMVDLHNDEFLIDFKTKDIDDPTKKMAWDEQAMQLAAYDEALGLHEGSPRRCINVFIDSTKPGLVVIHEWKPEEIKLAWQKFKLLVKYWQITKGYVPE